MRLLNVNKAMTATRMIHHVFNDYCQNPPRTGKDYEETMWEDVEFLASEFRSHIGSSWRSLRQHRTFNLFSARGMTRTTTAATKMTEAFEGLPAWLTYLKSSNIIFDEPDIERVMDDHGNPQDYQEDLEVVCVGGADGEAAPNPMPAVQKWIKDHPPREGENEDEQKEQIENLVDRSARRKVLWEKEQARKVAEQKEQEEADAAAALRAVSAAEKEWVLEAIVNKREVDGKVEYRVKWEGFASNHNTWESAENLIGARRAIALYEKKHKNKK